MKKSVAIITILTTCVIFTGCTQTKTQTPKESISPRSETKDKQVTQATPTPSALATFAPTNDEDIKTIDKNLDQVNYNDYSDKSLDDLK